MKKREYILLKSKDDYSFEHYKGSPMNKITGFTGTAGEAVQDITGHVILFVDPRYHIQARNQTKGKNVTLVKMSANSGFIEYLKKYIPEYSLLYIPQKSTPLSVYREMKERLSTIKISNYITVEDYTSIRNPAAPVFPVPLEIAGEDTGSKIKRLNSKNYLITNPDEIAYILNLRSFKTPYSASFRAKLFIKDESNVILFCDYKLPELPSFIKVKKLSEYEDYLRKQNELILVNSNSISLWDFNLIKKPDILKKSLAAEISAVKNQSELDHYKDSFKRLDNALLEFRSQIKEGLCELELNQIFKRALIKSGALALSFKTILAIGENTSIIHYTQYSKEKFLKQGQILLLDCGGYYKGGYATDITRVFGCKGEYDYKIKEIYTAVLRAQLNTYHSEILIGDELHKLAQEILRKYEMSDFYFPHGLGHGIGIPVHQFPPALNEKTKVKLRNGNVFSIEPGLYKDGVFGVRLENAVYLKDGKKIALSHFPYEEDLIDFNMLNDNELDWLKDWNKIAKEI